MIIQYNYLFNSDTRTSTQPVCLSGLPDYIAYSQFTSEADKRIVQNLRTSISITTEYWYCGQFRLPWPNLHTNTLLLSTLLIAHGAYFIHTHYSDVIMGAMASQNTNSTVFFHVQIKENIKAPRHWLLWNSPVTGEFPAQMASNAENVSIWWRHHVIKIQPITYSLVRILLWFKTPLKVNLYDNRVLSVLLCNFGSRYFENGCYLKMTFCTIAGDHSYIYNTICMYHLFWMSQISSPGIILGMNLVSERRR